MLPGVNTDFLRAFRAEPICTLN